MEDMVFIGVLLAGLFILFITALIPVFKTLVGIYPYAYTNARVRAMRSKLVKTEELEEFFSRPYNDIVYSLEKKTFQGLGKYLGADFSYASIDTALRTELVKTLIKVKKISPQQSQKFLLVLLSRYDISLIKSVVRSINLKLYNKQDIYHISEVFSKEFLAKRNITLEGLENELKGSIYYDILKRHFAEIQKKNFKEFEEELDLLLFKRLLFFSKSREARDYVKMLIDTQNVSLVLKSQEALIPGGYIKLQEYQKGMKVEELVKKLQEQGYKTNSEKKECLERDLYRELLQQGKAFMARNPLSEASLIGYIIIKTVNTRNLNILLKMKSHNFSTEKIKEVIA